MSDPLFQGMTRPAMLAGVTYSGVILNLMLVITPFVMFNSLWPLLAAMEIIGGRHLVVEHEFPPARVQDRRRTDRSARSGRRGPGWRRSSSSIASCVRRCIAAAPGGCTRTWIIGACTMRRRRCSAPDRRRRR